MRFVLLFTVAVWGTVAALAADPSPALMRWDRISVPPMKTSIYVGSVKLIAGEFERQGSTLTTTYDARVFPWFFWNETGHISITLSAEALAHLARSETVEFMGDARNHKNKPRAVTGRAQPADATSGKLKVRIMADGIELIFNGTYRLEAAR